MDENLKLHWREDPATCGWYISYLYRQGSVQMAAQLRDIDLSPAQSIVLVGIYRNEGINQRTLAQAISMAPGVVSRILRELEDRRLVEKRRDEENRRNYMLYLTEEGERRTEGSLAIQGQYWNGLLQVLTPEEAGTLSWLLRKVKEKALADSE